MTDIEQMSRAEFKAAIKAEVAEMESLGLVESRVHKGARKFRLTERGRRFAEALHNQTQALTEN
jgi:predicted transcriptional regulator